MTIPATLELNEFAETRWDSIVVGAGPAGSLAARQLAKAGVRVLLVDRKAFPRWKVCGACVSQRALAVLHSAGLGDTIERLGSIPVRKFELRSGKQRAVLRLPGGVAVSRTAFDAALVRSAIEAGAHFLPGTEAALEGTTENGRRVTLWQSDRRRVAQARVVLAAGGLGGGFLARSNQFRTKTVTGSRIGVGGTLVDCTDAVQPGTIYMFVARRGYVGVVRLEDGTVNVAAALDRLFVKRLGSVGAAVATVLTSAVRPEDRHLSAAVSNLQTNWHGTVSLTRQTLPVACDRVFVVGDAAGYVEPFTGEGIGWAVTSAMSVVPVAQRAVESWNPALAQQWSETYRAAIARRQRLCRVSAMALRHPLAVQGVVKLLSWMPSLANPFVRRLNTELSGVLPVAS